MSGSGELAFAIMDGDAVFADFDVSHEKEMHVMVVRDDLRHFSHIHPERDADGVWRVPFVPPFGGTYRIFGDFVDTKGNIHVISFDRAYDGNRGVSGIEEDTRLVKPMGEYVVTLTATPYARGALFTFDFARADGRPVYLEQYLGAPVHGSLISEDGDFIHTHPSVAGDGVVFGIPELSDPFYRVFTQFRIKGEFMTVEFDWKPSSLPEEHAH